ncbi:type III secretion system export apparatus subunit SctR [Cystobacter ferrugineus]|uniref:EscR/YscR/HrcR family type III secretion system export apparatus protein n=1 Tax=Cystobacter ferrugineus TaxID=83449 RepID=A0A1L9BAM9_9BACT|nr:type III secretion system export apparatus subunit SctR [Cystobacter ferrugineus]OJH39326.1 EscR/YscR/HrcR family type III secretion system export apparatus protein [Cystobacter ferrugineus]
MPSVRLPVPRLKPWLFALVFALDPVLAFAAKRGGSAPDAAMSVDSVNPESFASRPLVLMLALAALSLVPFVLMMVTSFVKISVVLSIVRQALGTQQIPPTQVITGLAIILTIYIMAPVGQAMYRAAEVDIMAKGPSLLSSESVGNLLEAANKAKEPLRAFLNKKITAKDRSLFFNLARLRATEEDRQNLTERDFMIIIPAFVVSELKQAFQIGFLLFVPFLAVDMVVANILQALGMNQLSPTTVSMPFKLLLFVVVDGWYLIAKGLVVGYL